MRLGWALYFCVMTGEWLWSGSDEKASILLHRIWCRTCWARSVLKAPLLRCAVVEYLWLLSSRWLFWTLCFVWFVILLYLLLKGWVFRPVRPRLIMCELKDGSFVGIKKRTDKGEEWSRYKPSTSRKAEYYQSGILLILGLPLWEDRWGHPSCCCGWRVVKGEHHQQQLGNHWPTHKL